MKYVVTKHGHCKLYAIRSSGGTVVVWNPQRNKASEFDKDSGVALANRYRGEVECAECGGNCDHILEALKAAVGC